MSRSRLVAATVVAVLIAGGAWAEKAGKKESSKKEDTGKSAGEQAWITDLDEAVAAARKANLPVFLSFSGSDWCEPCKLVDREVFSKPEWGKYAANKFILANIDMPRDEKKLSEKKLKANKEVIEKFEVEGFPTFVILDQTGTNEIKRFGLSQTPELYAFMRETGTALRDMPSEQQKIVDSLPEDRRARYRDLVAELKKLEREVEQWLKSKPSRTEENTAIIQEYSKQLSKIMAEVDSMEMDHLIPVYAPDAKDVGRNLNSFKSARASLESLARLYKAEMNFENWVLARPAPGPDSSTIYSRLLAEVETALKELDKAGEAKQE